MIGFKWGVDRNALGMAETGEARLRAIDMKAAAAECIAMCLFVIIGCGSACANGASDASQRLLVAFAFGMGILVLAYSVGHHSGGQINCAVTLSLVLGGQVPWYQGLANLVAQLVGSLMGAGLLCAVFPCDMDKTKNVGTNVINEPWGIGNVLVGEFLGTFILCYVVWETAVSPAASCGKNACIAIGFAVFLAHLILLPVDGCSINPTRSFGPAIVGAIRNCHEETSTKGLEDLWVMWVGPLLGGILAAALHVAFKPSSESITKVQNFEH
mmetsp:Transcript_3773/g.4685  ORF Transcript_3773/g.4685 Transcript_3773/m.4685 type:complete len:270 (-) Transcript_3773:237-1046(-)